MEPKPAAPLKHTSKSQKLAKLRRLVARFEPGVAHGPHIQTGFADIDAYLRQQVVPAGLPCGGLHEVVATRVGDMPAALGFAHRLAVRFLDRPHTQDMLLYGQTHMACREAGQPYGPALPAHGLSADRLVYIDGARLPDLLWAGEEALLCSAIGCIVLSSWDEAPSFTASRRLSLAARAAERPLVMALGAQAGGSASAATTRWQVEALPQQGWHVRLAKLRMSYTATPPPEGWRLYPQSLSQNSAQNILQSQPRDQAASRTARAG